LKLGEEWAKWVLDILRNLIVIAFLFFAAEKSGKWYMWVLAVVGFFSLHMFATAYIGQSQFNFGQTKGFGDTLLKVILMFAAFILVGAFSMGSLVAFRGTHAIVVYRNKPQILSHLVAPPTQNNR